MLICLALAKKVSVSRCSIHVNTLPRMSASRQLRVQLSQEWSGTRLRTPSHRNSRNNRLSVQCHPRLCSLTTRSKLLISSMRK